MQMTKEQSNVEMFSLNSNQKWSVSDPRIACGPDHSALSQTLLAVTSDWCPVLHITATSCIQLKLIHLMSDILMVSISYMLH